MRIDDIFTMSAEIMYGSQGQPENDDTPYDYELLSKLSKAPVPLTDMNESQLKQLPRLVQVGIVKVKGGYAHLTEVGENWFRGWEESKIERGINTAL